MSGREGGDSQGRWGTWILWAIAAFNLVWLLGVVGLSLNEAIVAGQPDESLARDAHDIYHGSAIVLYLGELACLPGFLAALVLRLTVTGSAALRKLCTIQAMGFLGCALGLFVIHQVLIRRITALTGQGFGWWP